MLRWLAGFLIILAAGWGVIGSFILTTQTLHWNLSWQKAILIIAIPDLFLFLLLQQKLWLSRFMGLRVGSDTSPIVEALYFWLLGVIGLLLRSTTHQAESTRSEEKAQPNTLREVLETVVFVVVLVVLLKAFAAEAFVIPTGSMATTLLGYNKHVECPMCGAKFPVNASDEAGKGGETKRIVECTCFNCRYRINFTRDEVTPSTSSGDRVLVAKFLDDLGLIPFKPLDVVVFKFPEEPLEDYSPKNYIKRLIGMPDQTIGIWYGNIYVAQKADLIKKGVSFEVLEDEKDLPLRRQMHKNTRQAVDLLEAGDPVFQIMRKPPDKQLALERPVYDNDHPAKDLVEAHFPPRWAAEADDANAPEEAWKAGYQRKRQRAQEQDTPWKPDDAHGFVFGGSAASKKWWLRYRNLIAHNRDSLPNPPLPELITDFLSYNTGVYNTGESQDRSNGQRWVGDLLLECEVKVDKAQGNLILELSKGTDRFQARFDLNTGKCTLYRGQKELAARDTRLSKPGTYRLRFGNVDRRLTVWVDRDLPFDDGVNYDPPQTADGRHLHGPDKHNDLEPASIGVQGDAVLAVHHIRLGRDTYYTVQGDESRSQDADFWSDPDKWGGYEVRGMTMYVQPDHYLCMGDNSPASSDSRTWEKGRGSGPGGLVPHRLMLGRALMIYYPFYRFGRIK
jgi:signal peptidase I